MAWMACRSCSAKFAVGLLRCPQCSSVSELFAAPEEIVDAEQEQNMPKISVEGGASNAADEQDETDTGSESEAHVEQETPADQSPSRTDETAATSDDADSAAQDDVTPNGDEKAPNTAADEKADAADDKAKAADANPAKPAASTAKAAKKAAAAKP